MTNKKIEMKREYYKKCRVPCLRPKLAGLPCLPCPGKKTKKELRNESEGHTESVIQFLAIEGHYSSRIQSQGQYNEKLGRWTPTVRRGIVDNIMAIINGRTIMIEIKVDGDAESENQKQTKRKVEASGGVYLIVRSCNWFMDWYFPRAKKHFKTMP